MYIASFLLLQLHKLFLQDKKKLCKSYPWATALVGEIIVSVSNSSYTYSSQYINTNELWRWRSVLNAPNSQQTIHPTDQQTILPTDHSPNRPFTQQTIHPTDHSPNRPFSVRGNPTANRRQTMAMANWQSGDERHFILKSQWRGRHGEQGLKNTQNCTQAHPNTWDVPFSKTGEPQADWGRCPLPVSWTRGQGRGFYRMVCLQNSSCTLRA